MGKESKSLRKDKIRERGVREEKRGEQEGRIEEKMSAGIGE